MYLLLLYTIKLYIHYRILLLYNTISVLFWDLNIFQCKNNTYRRKYIFVSQYWKRKKIISYNTNQYSYVHLISENSSDLESTHPVRVQRYKMACSEPEIARSFSDRIYGGLCRVPVAAQSPYTCKTMLYFLLDIRGR